MATGTKKKGVQTRISTVAAGVSNASSAKVSPASQEEGPKMDISGLFAEMTKLGTILTSVAADVSHIKSDMVEFKNTISAIQIWMTEAEGRISDVEDKMRSITEDNGKNAKKLEQLWARVDDQENRNRRKNVRLIGLEEGLESGGSINDYVMKILADGLGLRGEEYELERCHRSTRPRSGPGQPPRIVLVRFLRYTARQKVLMTAKQKKGILWENCHLSFYEDMTAERAAQRKLFSPVMKKLWQHQIKHTLAHPAKLRLTWKGQQKSFDSVEEAEKLVRENFQEVVE